MGDFVIQVLRNIYNIFLKAAKIGEEDYYWFATGLWSLHAAGSHILGLLLAQQRGNLGPDLTE